MITPTPLEKWILGAILLGCIWYIYRGITRLFSTTEKRGNCGECGQSHCAGGRPPSTLKPPKKSSRAL